MWQYHISSSTMMRYGSKVRSLVHEVPLGGIKFLESLEQASSSSVWLIQLRTKTVINEEFQYGFTGY